MKRTDPLWAGIIATSVFTIYSYWLSRLQHENFKEPKLLGQLLDPVSDPANDEAQFSGWLLHYAVGISLAAVYKQLIQITGMKTTLKNGALAGLATGLPAVGIWNKALKLHPHPPRKRTWDYFMQLYAGHIIFGVTCFLVLTGSRPASKNHVRG